jgi:hypothetical protein
LQGCENVRSQTGISIDAIEKPTVASRAQ